MSLFKGSGVALITPFDEQLNINYDVLEQLIKFHIKNKTDALVVCGTTAESATLSLKEKKDLIKFVVEKTNHHIPVIAGTGSNNTQASIELSIYAQSVGANGLLVVSPYYNKPTQKGIIAHYEAIAKAVDIPIILYNVPGRTASNIEVDTVLKLAEIKNIIGIKEASGDLEQIEKLCKLCPLDFDIYSGNDDQTQTILKMGGKGVISVTANIIPKDIHETSILLKDDQYLKPLHDVMFIESNPVPVKAALNYLGFHVGKTRLPLVNLEDEHYQLLIQVLNDFGLKEGLYENFN